MQKLHNICAGLDVHKKFVTACIRRERGDKVTYEVKNFGTATRDLVKLFDWLAAADVERVVMESTGVYWKPVWKVLEARFDLCLANAHEVKNVPGRKSDVKDAQWLSRLHAEGLVSPSFVPDRWQQQMRELTRSSRKLAQTRAEQKQRIQKVLESCNIKLASVLSDVLSKSGRAIIKALIEGEIIDPNKLARLAVGSAKDKFILLAHALKGDVREHDRFLLQTYLDLHDYLQKQIDRLHARIQEVMSERFRDAVARLAAIPGFSEQRAIEVLAEIGIDMRTFRNGDALVSWARLSPRSDSTGGKRRSTRTMKGSRWIKPMMVQSAWAAARTKSSSLRGDYHRLRGRAGPKKAVVALAAKMLRIIYAMLANGTEYQDARPEQMTQRQRERAIRRGIQRLEGLGLDTSSLREQLEAIASAPTKLAMTRATT